MHGIVPAPMQVYIHVTTVSASSSVLHSTRREAGGTGLPIALVLGKGIRAPRGWELALQGAPVCSHCTPAFYTSVKGDIVSLTMLPHWMTPQHSVMTASPNLTVTACDCSLVQLVYSSTKVQQALCSVSTNFP